MSSPIALVHLHIDFEQPLTKLLRKWNLVQHMIEFIGVRPSRKFEQRLLTPGAISDDDASETAAQIRTDAGFRADDGIVVFTEKRLFDEKYFQLFVGGREADETPPRIGILSLDYLRLAYQSAESAEPRLFSAIVSNILFSVGVDVGLEDHGKDTRGCIMDFCEFMPDIEVGLTHGPGFCDDCRSLLKAKGPVGDAVLALPGALQAMNDITTVDRDVTEAILLRGKRYSRDPDRFDYDVALSFSGMDRGYARELANALSEASIRVFYDESEEAALWGTNLQLYLGELYRLRARYCVVLISARYVENRWTEMELEAALTAEFERRETYVLPLRLDDTPLRHLASTRAFVDARKKTIDEIVQLIKQRLTDETEKAI